MDNRLEGAHRARHAALEGRVKDLEEEVRQRDEANLTLISDLDAEKKKFEAKDGELAVQKVDNDGLRVKVSELTQEVEGLRERLKASEENCASVDAQLKLRTHDLTQRTEEVQKVKDRFRTRVQRLLRRQWRAHRRACWDKNRASKNILEGYLKSRKDFDGVDKLLSQAEGTEAILKSLVTKGVPIPDDVSAEVTGKISEYTKAKSKLSCGKIYPDDFYVDLPEGLGFPNMDTIDLGVTSEEEGESSEEDPGIIEEESSEEEEDEEDIPEESLPTVALRRTGSDVDDDGGEKVSEGVDGPDSSDRNTSDPVMAAVAQPTPSTVLGPEAPAQQTETGENVVHAEDEEEGRVELEGNVSPPTLESV